MAKLERHFAGVPFKAQTFRRADVSQLADTGQVLEAQAISQLGGDISEVGAVVQKWYEREGNTQFDTARADTQGRVGEFERTTFANADDHDKGFKQLLSDIDKLAPKNKSGAKKFKTWTQANKESLVKLSAEKKIRFIARQNQIALFNNLSNVAKITDPIKAEKEIDTLIRGGLDDGTIKTAKQAFDMKERFTEDWLSADTWRQATDVIRPDGEVDWTQAVNWLNQAQNVADIDADVVKSLKSDANTQKDQQDGRDREKIEVQREIDRGTIYDGIHEGKITRTEIEATSLGEDEQSAKWEMAQREAERKARGELIVTDPKIRSGILRNITGIITGATTRAEVTQQANDARFGDFTDPVNPTEPTIDENAYTEITKAIEAQYEQGFGQMMSKVESYARGILLNPDSLGFIKNAPVRYQSLGDFQEAWLRWIAEQGDKLKLSDIYPEGRKLAAAYQISDTEAERREKDIEAGLRARETEPKIEVRIEGETIQEYLKRTVK